MARLMTPHYIQVKPDWTVAEILAHIKSKVNMQNADIRFMVDDDNKLIDDLKIGQILMAETTSTVRELMDYSFISIKSATPGRRKDLKYLKKYDRSAMPIITENGIPGGYCLLMISWIKSMIGIQRIFKNLEVSKGLNYPIPKLHGLNW